jgi:hypothetical protein
VYPCFTTTANLLTCLISNYSIVWPAHQGSINTVLTNDGSGNLSWSSVSGASVTAVTGAGVISVETVSGTAVVSLTGVVDFPNGGTGQTTKTAAFNALSPQTTTGDLIIYGAGSAVRLPVGASKQVLTVNLATTAGVDWEPAGALTANGSLASPNLISAIDGIVILGVQREFQFVKGSGPTTVTANPQIEAGSTVGQELILAGADNTNTVTLSNGNGLSLNGRIVMGLSGAGSQLYLVWNGSVWSEISRR